MSHMKVFHHPKTPGMSADFYTVDGTVTVTTAWTRQQQNDALKCLHCNAWCDHIDAVTEYRQTRPAVVILTKVGESRVLGGIAGMIMAVDHWSQVPGGQLMAHVRDGSQPWSLGEDHYLMPRAQ